MYLRSFCSAAIVVASSWACGDGPQVPHSDVASGENPEDASPGAKPTGENPEDTSPGSEPDAPQTCAPGAWQAGAYVIPCLSAKPQQHVFGNRFVNAIGSGNGDVSLFVDDRGPAIVGSGGWSVVSVDGNWFGTLAGLVPTTGSVIQTLEADAQTTKVTAHGVSVEHRITAVGDGLQDDVRVTNVSSTPHTVEHYEIWVPSYFPLSAPTSFLYPSAFPFTLINVEVEGKRKAFASTFHTTTTFETDLLRIERTWPEAPPVDSSQRSSVNYYPSPITLKASGGAWHADVPAAAREVIQEQNVQIRKHTTTLDPGAHTEYSFWYGLQRTPAPPDPASSAPSSVDLGAADCPLSAAHCETLAREAKWKASALSGWSLWRPYFDKFAVPQGSLYYYKQGVDEAPRDLHQMVAGLAKTDVSLAKSVLETAMQWRSCEDGNLSYGYFGYGCAGDAACPDQNPKTFGIRADLDLYFLWAVNQFRDGAISDDAFTTWLTTHEVPFYPTGCTTLPPGATGRAPLDHIRAAFAHLRDGVGRGPNGLMRMHNGDWNDAILNATGIDYKLSVQYGESVPVSQMVVSILPKTAAWLTEFDETLAAKMTAYGESLAEPLKTKAWVNTDTQNHFLRAYLRNSKNEVVTLGTDYLDLEAQVWALQNDTFTVAEILSAAQSDALLNRVWTELDAPSPIGATIWPASHTGTSAYAGLCSKSWSSERQLLTRAYFYAGQDDKAWTSLYKSSFANHAALFPNVWSGTLSGPDGWDPSNGLAWDIPYALNMNAFPYANTNPNAVWLWNYLH